MATPDEIVHRFTYHPPTPEQLPKYNEIREHARSFALRIAELVPRSREQSTALTKLDEVVMHANAGIARHTRKVSDTLTNGTLPQVRIKESDFIKDPKPAFEEAAKRPVVLTDENGQTVAILSIP